MTAEKRTGDHVSRVLTPLELEMLTTNFQIAHCPFAGPGFALGRHFRGE
jgi:hypothetical protein